MNHGRTIFSQLMDFVPYYQFQKAVDRYDGNKWIRSFSCWNQFLCMSFAQLTGRRSLRDIEVCLNAQSSKLYHLGIRGKVAKSTLSDANNNRDYRIFRDFAYQLIDIAHDLYADEKLGLELLNSVYAFDSTTIDLCLSLFPWAKFRKKKAAVKMHTLLDLHSNIPMFIEITPASVHDVNILDYLLIEPGAFLVVDRGYIDYERLYRLSQGAVFFIIRAKKNIQFRRIYSHTVDRKTGLICDQTIEMTGPKTSKLYPQYLRRIRFHDAENEKNLVFLTNNFNVSALTIAELYKYRWQIELFFKWIKQHLRIKSFYGLTENAVKTQIWIAVANYLLVAIAKKRLKLEQNLYTILQILSISIFEKVDILQLFTNNDNNKIELVNSKQLSLLD